MPASYESLRAELDDIVEQYRAHIARDGSKAGLTREEAVKRIRQLGFTEGDALRWLGLKPRSKPLRPTSRQQRPPLAAAETSTGARLPTAPTRG
jgi:hypothetical protein